MTALLCDDPQSTVCRVACPVCLVTAENDDSMNFVSAALDKMYGVDGAVVPAFCRGARRPILDGELFACASNADLSAGYPDKREI